MKVKKILASLLAAMILMVNVVPAAAAETDLERKIQETVTNRQYFVYKLTDMILDPELSLNRTIVDDDFFDRKTAAGLSGIMGWKDISSALFGSDCYEAKYYRKIMAECVMPGKVTDSNGVDWAVVGLDEEILYDKTKEHLEMLGVPKSELDEIKFVHEAFGAGLSLAEDSAEVGSLMNKMTRYSSAHLNALELISKHTEQSTPINGSAKWVIDVADSTEFKDTFQDYMSLFYLELMEGLVDASLAAITFSASEFFGAAYEIMVGDKQEQEMNELFYLNLQGEIASVFYKLTEEYPNVLQSHYTTDEIYDLTNLVLLYLRCGQLGFSFHHPENADACAEAYKELQRMSFPWIEECGNTAETTTPATPAANVYVSNYNVPGNISKGDYFVISGTVNSDAIIHTVKAEVTGANGYLCATAENVNSNQFDIATLDSQMRFNDLMLGDYNYQVTVFTDNGEHKVIDSQFQVKAENGEMIIVGYRLPHDMNVGDVFYVTGTVKSKTPMTSVTVEILNEAGNFMTGGTANGSYTSFDLSWLDRYVEFNKVPLGRYYYVIKATNSYGEEILVNQPYLVR